VKSEGCEQAAWFSLSLATHFKRLGFTYDRISTLFASYVLAEFDVHGSVHLGNIYIYIYIFDCKSNKIHMDFFICILYYTILALRASGAFCTHHQEYKLQSTAVGTRDCYGVLKLDSPLEQVAAGTPSHLHLRT
jgi:hypothetical protein